jgi:hypothetical protein
VTVSPTAELSAEAVRLAVALSVATRIEPELLRAVRLETLPDLDVGHESELWFSDWVARGPDAVSLRSEILPGLRERLTQLLAEADPGHPLHRLGAVVAEVHARSSAALRLEEQIAWLAVLRPPGHEEAIDTALEAALRALVEDEREGIADWFAGAARRLPAEAKGTRTAWLLATAAARRHPAVMTAMGNRMPEGLATDDVARISRLLDAVLLNLSWDGPDLIISADEAGGRLGVLVPDTDPRLVETVIGSRKRTYRIPAGERVRVPGPGRGAQLRTAFGTVFDIADPAQFALVETLFLRLGVEAFRTVREALPVIEIFAETVRVGESTLDVATDETIFARGVFTVSLPAATMRRIGPWIGVIESALGETYRTSARRRGWIVADDMVHIGLAEDRRLTGRFRVEVTREGPR